MKEKNIPIKIPIKKYTNKDFAWTAWNARQLHIQVEKMLKNMQKTLGDIIAIPANKRNFENTVYPLTQIYSLDEGGVFQTEAISLLSETSPSALVRAMARKELIRIEKYVMESVYTDALYSAIHELLALKPKVAAYEQKYIIYVLDKFRDLGFDLTPVKRSQLQKLKTELSVLESIFSECLNTYQDHILVTREDLVDLPESYIASLPREKNKYKVTLASPHIIPFIEYASNDVLRRSIIDKNVQKGGKKNLVTLEKILKKRHVVASLLGFSNFAEYVISKKMAKTPQVVNHFLTTTIRALKPSAHKEFKQLSQYVKQHDPKKSLAYFNNAWYLKKYEKECVGFDDNQIREYFPLEAVRDGVFAIFGKIYGIAFRRSKIPTWHKEVFVYEVYDIKTKKFFGYLGFDLFPRKGKYQHAAAFSAIRSGVYGMEVHKKHYSGFEIMVSNIRKPTSQNPSLLSHDEVTTYLHEFGHMLHAVLSEATLSSQSGNNTVEDFVEVPSQFHEHWAWHPESLRLIARHYKTGKPMPRPMMDALIASRYFFSASSKLRTFVLSSLDMAMHTGVLKDDLISLRKKFDIYNYFKGSPHSLFPAGWGHMANGLYTAGYYGYMWSIVYAYDCFSRFEKEGIMNKKLGAAFRREILAMGSARPEMESLKKFLGRAPNNKAFLKALGIK